ncbi:hypothetical protein HDV63DRAFT_29304 [Trichoderma sp. SZMC 28014]
MENTTPAQIRRTLETLPRRPNAFQDAYEKTIERICGQQTAYRQLSKRTLQWLGCAARELKIVELRHAIEMRQDNDCSPGEEELESSSLIVEVCMGLVTISEDRGIIRLLHHTALEYLQQNMTCLWKLGGAEITHSLTNGLEDNGALTAKAY